MTASIQSVSVGDVQNSTANHDNGNAILQLRDVSYAYTKGGKRVLQHINHDFHSGVVHAITGPSGAGTTTLLSLISGLTTPTEGQVL